MTATSARAVDGPGATEARDGSRVALRLAIAALVANSLIVLTGVLVRLTGSGLGCPTWPRCTADSFVTTAEMGGHGVIEFGNRVLGIVVGLVTLAMLVAVLRHRGRPRAATPLAGAALVGVLAQGVIGGLSVRRELAPEVVAVHFLVSMIIVAVITLLVDVLRHSAARYRTPVHLKTGWIIAALPVALSVVLVLGAFVTGSGPHAGDEGARRFDLDPAALSRAHADAVLVFLGLQVAALIALRVTKAAADQWRAGLVLLGASLFQGLVGYMQYALDLPVPLVAAHVLAAALVTIATVYVFLTVWRSASTN